MDVILDPVLLVRGAFLGASIVILVVYAIPPLRSRLLAYGSRSSTSTSTFAPHTPPSDPLSHLLDLVAAQRVPHTYFLHFYLLSTLNLALWTQQYTPHPKGLAFRILTTHYDLSRPSMSIRQVHLTWLLLLLQSVRRLAECVAYMRPTNARMWLGHWAMGLLFYLGIGIAVWLEGVPALLQDKRAYGLPMSWYRATPLIFLFMIASAAQFAVHRYLFLLPKPQSASVPYTRPRHWTFARCVAPHYFCETVVYACLALLAAPEGRWVNWTVACGAMFVAVNLGATAIGTREFWVRTWGEESVRGRARMLPFVW